jgi:hypothetical protein
MVGTIGLAEVVVLLSAVLVGALVVVWPVSRILSRLGFPVWLAPIAAIPLLNIVLLYFVAFNTPPTDISRPRG